MENHHAIHGQTIFFDWAMFNSYDSLQESRLYNILYHAQEVNMTYDLICIYNTSIQLYRHTYNGILI